MDRDRNTTRRDLLVGALALGAIAWGWQRFGVGRDGLAFEPIEGLPGWRRVSVGPVSTPGGTATSAVLVGIGGSDPADRLPPDRMCSALFRKIGAGDLRVAMFTDFFCPYCRVLSGRVAALGLTVDWHQLPLLGPSSVIAARAAEAAGLQGGYEAFQSALLAAPFRPTDAAFAAAAEAAGLDPARLLLDMEGPETARRISESRAAAETLGIWGTPALVVGRTLILGDIATGTLDRLIALEREDGAWRTLCA